mmetsp:Transcript_12581/g.16360  ORF Transcript_12581/g.16360 Transcript_12581/m.16360 type:complete len:436 (+) Transcript_12581:127-1434(+)
MEMRNSLSLASMFEYMKDTWLCKFSVVFLLSTMLPFGKALKNIGAFLNVPYFRTIRSASLEYLRVQSGSMMSEQFLKSNIRKSKSLLAAPVANTAELPEQTAASPSLEFEDFELSISTFNVLAPCYKRIGGKALGGSLKPRPREAQFPELWKDRASKLANFLVTSLEDSDIICLQEYWFEPGFQKIFQRALSRRYHFFGACRTGNKSDGLLMLLDKRRYKVAESRACALSEVGQRIALMLHIQKVEGQDPGFLLANTHLSFPHSVFERQQQYTQVNTLARMLEEYSLEANLPKNTPKIIVGDFNVEETDPVFGFLRDKGFRSSREGKPKFVSHFNHRGEAVGCDHILIHAPSRGAQTKRKKSKSSLPKLKCASAAPYSSANNGPESLFEKPAQGYSVDVVSSTVQPTEYDAAFWPSDFGISDHRPLHARLKFSSL